MNSPQSIPEALSDPRAYPHPAHDFALVETHISWVFLAGERTDSLTYARHWGPPRT